MKILFLLLGLLACSMDSQLHEIAVKEPVGVQQEQIIDTGYMESLPQQLDVLVVLDTSCSMADDALIHYGLARIPEELQGHNWQLMYISADPGAEEQNPVDPQDPDPEWASMEAIESMMGFGRGVEAGIGAATAFLLRNPGWARPGVKTIIVFVSDERDQSAVRPQDLLASWPNQLEIVAVVGLPVEQRTGPCSADVGTGYLNIADKTVDICTSSRWSIF